MSVFILAKDYLGFAYLQFKAFPPHSLDQNRQVQFPTAFYYKSIGVFGFFHPQSHVGLDLFHQPVTKVTAGYILPFLAGKRTVIYKEFHGQGGLVDFDACQGFRLFRVCNGIADFHLAEADQCHNVTGLYLRHLCPFQTLIGIKTADFFYINFFFMHQGDLLPVSDSTAYYAAYYDTPHIRIVVQCVGQHLQRLIHFHIRCGNRIQNDLEQRLQIIAFIFHGQLGKTGTGRSINHREFQLLVISFQFNEQVQHLINHFGCPLVRTVNLIDDHNRLQMFFQSLPQYIFRLGHGTFIGVNQQQNAVHHGEDPLHFPAKVCMAGSIQNIDLGSVVHNGSVFG